MTDFSQSSCPKCGAPISSDSPQGLCPKCVLDAAASDPYATTAHLGKTPPPTVEQVTAHFPDLEVIELLGAGGMGAVYKARQPKLDRFVALKILSADLVDDPAFAERFNREGRVLARLNHPNIVSVYDFGTQGPYLYLMLEYVDGVNLREAMQAGEFSPADCLALVQDICAALNFAHDEGILHRDIKPENILLDARGRVKIADFGLAKLVGKDGRDDVTLTRQGAVMGTLHYMAPEQFETPQDVDQRADIYSLGVVFYELLTGELPIGLFAPPSDKSPLDPRVDEVVMRALERKRERRFQSVDDVRSEVEAISQTDFDQQSYASNYTSRSSPDESEKLPWLAISSAMLTGFSFLLAVVALIALPNLLYGVSDQISAAVTAITVLGVGIPALVGTILGWIALGQISKSGGQADGFGSAIFGALTWPVILMAGLIGMLAPIPLIIVGVGVATPIVLMFELAIIGLIIGYLVRAVGRWALVVEDGEPSPAKVKVAVGLYVTVMVLWLGVVLTMLVVPADSGDDFGPQFDERTLQSGTAGDNNSTSLRLP